MAYPGEIHRGDTVRWADWSANREREGVVVRCAKDGMWADVRSPIPPSLPFSDVTHLTRRVSIVKLRLVRKAEES